jgi:hypothetical protein
LLNVVKKLDVVVFGAGVRKNILITTAAVPRRRFYEQFPTKLSAGNLGRKLHKLFILKVLPKKK